MDNRTDPRFTVSQQRAGTSVPRAGGASYDAGLRSYMLNVYNYMAGGVALTGVVSWLFASSGMAASLFTSGGIMQWVVMLAPLGFVLALSFGINKMSTATAQAVFWAFAAVMGVSISYIFLAYTGTSIAKVFFITAAAFGGLSLYGYTTKKDLSGLGTFLIMGVIGLIIASVVNIFLQSSMFDFVISILGVLIFAGLTAYDTQKIKNMYFQVAGTNMMGKTVIMGALSLYLDFINMFLFLLRLFGSRE
ncbi:MAG: Bax inhibitor-1/YccA family protein [Pacificimonas sp.]